MFTETRSVLLALHLLNGEDVLVNPAFIVTAERAWKTLVQPTDVGYERETDQVGTVLHLSNGKTVTVEETLEDVMAR